MKLKCLDCGWYGDAGQVSTYIHDGQWPGDEEVDQNCPVCGSDELEETQYAGVA